MPFDKQTGRVACIGAGVIGGGWAAHFLAKGFDVVVWDPHPDAEGALRRLLKLAWPALEELGLAAEASPDRLSFAASLKEAVAAVDFVQESAPERLELKQRLLAELATETPANVVIASSTSGFSITEMARSTHDASRLVVGHPFNPPYLIPLVEVVGGERSETWAVERACAFYQAAGKSVIRLERELPGFIGNRLQDAIWREALHMVAAGEATVEQIDQAIVDGPGLRWALMGPCLTFHLAGGEGGMAHMLDHFGPSLKEPWTRLEAPELTPALRNAMVEGCTQEAASRTIGDLVRERDRGLVAILKALRAGRAGGARATSQTG
ncbi:MAG TPA: 3-hydroxyacyl-CoA dehydrogenase NAD-binding domain-containing protein [Kiloniellales bacterium]|jgi:carnitine 3-dehydrogenase|nr:3-hydroxyacyl-CoA dehydrogenase NAD-binding domain-containing protein [Kiloniellales bacterium]